MAGARLCAARSRRRLFGGGHFVASPASLVFSRGEALSSASIPGRALSPSSARSRQRPTRRLPKGPRQGQSETCVAWIPPPSSAPSGGDIIWHNQGGVKKYNGTKRRS